MTLTKPEILEMYKDFSARFTNHLLRVLNEDMDRDSNISISPSRLQAVLVLLANWASDDVKRQILDIVGSDVMDIREADTLCDKNRLMVTPWEDEESDFIPTIEQQAILWVMQDADVKDAALQAVAPWYDLQMKRVDFAKEETTSLINETIEKATHGLIKELGIEIDQETQMLITDILYFMAKWENSFDEDKTKEQLFYGTAGRIKIIVKETEIEAATVTSFFAAGCPPPEIEKRPITMTVNRPFLFEIVEDFSNTILFTGIINNIDEIC